MRTYPVQTCKLCGKAKRDVGLRDQLCPKCKVVPVLDCVCRKCGKRKLAKDFGKQSRSPNGLNKDCKLCRKLVTSPLAKICGKCGLPKASSEFHKSINNRDGLQHTCITCKYGKNRSPDENRLRRYGLTSEKFEALYESQNGKCPICLRDLEQLRAHIDHCHDSGRIRGILCSTCNQGLGNFVDSQFRLSRAIEYLNKDAR